jgi:hypothetical protein
VTDKKKQTDKRDIIKEIARELEAQLRKPISENDGDYSELLKNRTMQHALSVSVGKPTPPDVDADGRLKGDGEFTSDGDNSPKAALRRFGAELNVEKLMNGEADDVDADDPDSVVELLARAVLARRK